MGDELRAAAERILENTTKAETPTGPQYQQDCNRKHWFLAEPYELARAYLAEHPADDAEPVTEEWLRSVGFKDAATVFLRPAIALGVVLAVLPYGGQGWRWSIGIERTAFYGLPDQPTRGAARRLLTALGVPLTSPPEATA